MFNLFRKKDPIEQSRDAAKKAFKYLLPDMHLPEKAMLETFFHDQLRLIMDSSDHRPGHDGKHEKRVLLYRNKKEKPKGRGEKAIFVPDFQAFLDTIDLLVDKPHYHFDAYTSGYYW